MDFVTNTNVVVDYEKNANNRAAVLAYDTLIALIWVLQTLFHQINYKHGSNR